MYSTFAIIKRLQVQRVSVRGYSGGKERFSQILNFSSGFISHRRRSRLLRWKRSRRVRERLAGRHHRPRSEECLRGESQAHLRYTLFAAQAQTEGFSTVARLFTAISFAEQIHATNYFKTLGQLNGAFITHSMAGFGPGNASKNLGLAIGGENFEVTTMYPAYKNKATQENATDAELYFSRALQAEQSHLTIFQQAKQSVDSGSDAPFQKIYVCPVCGRVVADNAPDFCPVCGTPKSQFIVY